ncbi:MAG: hypothetical protein M3320_00040 [Actinomycetota bacterium]|nr:hypothetical protein [Actinomycetota bacterium]
MQHWLKMVGAANWPLPNEWLADGGGRRTDLLDRVRFSRSRRPSGVRAGDRLVYYAAKWQRYFAVVEVISTESYEEEAESRWPLALDVEAKLLVPKLSIAPPVTDLNLRAGNYSVRTQSHIALNREQYARAVAGLAAVAS